MATLPQIQTVPELIGQHLGSSVLNHVLLGFGILQLWLISPLVSADEIVKCRSRTGQLIYSDAPCEKQSASRIGTVDGSPNQVPGIKRPRVEADQGTVRGATEALSAPTEGVPYVNGFIGNKPVRFMVDTGASEVSIPYKKAIDLGIPVFAGQRAEFSTASGRVGVYRVRLESITVGNITVRNVAAHVALNESGTQDVLLGMSFLRYVSLVMRHGTVAIGP